MFHSAPKTIRIHYLTCSILPWYSPRIEHVSEYLIPTRWNTLTGGSVWVRSIGGAIGALTGVPSQAVALTGVALTGVPSQALPPTGHEVTTGDRRRGDRSPATWAHHLGPPPGPTTWACHLAPPCPATWAHHLGLPPGSAVPYHLAVGRSGMRSGPPGGGVFHPF